jgi:predicted GIY-YIG superfamily endonuclease
MENYYLYYHKNPLTKDLFYIGIGTNKRAWDFTSGRNPHYKNYIKKYGEPLVDIIKENLTKKEACSLEIKLISKYGRKGIETDGILLNKSSGGEIIALGNKFTKEQKKKISQAKKGQKYNIPEGRIHGSKGKSKPKGFMSDELREKISIANKGKKHNKVHSNKGIPRSEETKLKIGKSNSKPKPKGFGDLIKSKVNYKLIGEKNSKPILQLDKQNNLINEFKSIKDALECLNKSPNNSCITSCLKGRQKTAFGFIWKYKK